MAGRTPVDAVENYVGPLQVAVSVVAPAVWNVSGGYDLGREHTATTGKPFKLRGVPLYMSITQQYRIVKATGESGPYRVHTTAYNYAMEDPGAQEIIAFHWHPNVANVPRPHIHLKAGAKVQRPQLQKAHIPSGRVAVEDVIRLAITEFGARPLRKQWADLLESTQAAFEHWRTWG